MAWKALKVGMAIIPGLCVYLIVSGVAASSGADPNLALFVGSLSGAGTFWIIVKNIKD